MKSDEEAASNVYSDADELIVRAKSDRAAFSQLYERYYSEVLRYCLRRLRVRAVAEDVISDVFLQIASHLRTFPGQTETDFRRWIFRIATNAVNACLRQTHRRRELLAEAARSRRYPSGIAATDDGNRDWTSIHQVISELNSRDQSIVMLRFFSECTHDEIASIVGTKAGTIRTALSRILLRLRERLKHSDRIDHEEDDSHSAG